ncbi:MAG: PepSY-like domain-containing protein [Capnocytophaga sp.]|nr:PepSY-like domain-containing protein [Capnocytophaga sp.]
MKAVVKSIAVVGALFLGQSAMAQADRQVQFSELPKNAQSFVKQHFANQNIASTWYDADPSDQDYKVHFDNGDEIEFFTNGEWEEVKSRNGKVPNAIIPNGIANYVKQNYTSTEIYKIQKKRYGYEVELSNGMDLEFNQKGEFLRIDN